MRLVCDKCSSIYTIEDDLVGGRDFRVACKQCGTPIVVRGARQVSSLPPLGNALPVSLPPRPKAPSTSFSPQGGEKWFVSLDQQQQGPYSAVELARLLEQERITWATPVWREGMKAWRPARRDAVLVTAVAGARGYAGDTMRLSASRSFLAAEDTVVDIAPEAAREALAAAAGAEDLLSSTSETKTIDARSDLPDLRPSERPAAWDSPENQAFRARLGLFDSHNLGGLGVETKESPAPTLAEAFRSAPSLMTHSGHPESTAEMPISARAAATEGWMPRTQSFWAVAGLAFAGGVLAAALYARVALPEMAPAENAVAPAPAPVAKVAAPKPSPVAAPVKVEPPSQRAAPPVRELPEPDELRSAVRLVAADVKRCVLNPAQGVDVDIYLDGPSGRVRDVDVRSPQMPAGRVECVTHAVRKLQLPPFTRQELKLMHKFSW